MLSPRTWSLQTIASCALTVALATGPAGCLPEGDGPSSQHLDAGSDARLSTDTVVDRTDAASAVDCFERRPTTLTRDTSIIFRSNTRTVTFESVYGAFGGTESRVLTIDQDTYAALLFTTESQSASSSGSVSMARHIVFPRGPMLVSISRCKGDFSPHLDDACRKILDPANSDEIDWAIEPSRSDQCDLELDTDYYFNIVPTLERPTNQEPQWACGLSKTEAPYASAASCSVASTAGAF